MRSSASGRARPVGLGVLLFALLLFVVPLRMFNSGGHPLAGAEQIDLCAILEHDALRALPGPVLTVQREIPGFAERPPGTCYVQLTAPESSEVSVTLMNRRYLSQGSIRFKTEKYIETFFEEERASGNTVVTVPGPWTAGATIQRHRDAQQLDLLAEDGGVVLWFRGKELTGAELVGFAAATAATLRNSGAKNP